MRLVFDTNVFVAASASEGVCAKLVVNSLDHDEVFTSPAVLDELLEKLMVKLRMPAAEAQ